MLIHLLTGWGFVLQCPDSSQSSEECVRGISEDYRCCQQVSYSVLWICKWYM